jgi:hypothetical protein
VRGPSAVRAEQAVIPRSCQPAANRLRDASRAKAALSLQTDKSDRKDAFGLAQVVRTSWFREVVIKSMDAETLCMLLVAAVVVGRQLWKRPDQGGRTAITEIAVSIAA